MTGRDAGPLPLTPRPAERDGCGRQSRTLRKVVGQHTLDQTLSETDKINLDIRKILDVSTVSLGVEVTLVELKDIQLPESMKRAMARQAERGKRAKIINAEGEAMAAAALGEASDMMMAHPLALQLRNLQGLVEIGVDKNTTVVFPAPLMSTITATAGEQAIAPGGAGAADAAGALAFPDMPWLGLDKLLVQLVDRANDVLAAQGRLRGCCAPTP
jgi:SPFH domain / Band 7 family